MPRSPLAQRLSLLGALALLSSIGLLAPACITTGAVQCGEDGFCPPGTLCTPKQDPPVCVPARGCGNDEIDKAAGEACDDGNIKDGDGCNSTCTSEEVCGNRFVDVQLDEPEECDAGEETSVCDDDCTRPECGDEHVNREAGEVCDDGNTEPGDGCDEKCKSEECGNGITEEAFGEECDDGKHCENGDECRDDSDCEGIDDEVCKPRSNDDCSADCQLELCGNGNIDSGEKCDEREGTPAYANHNDACIVQSSTQCAEATCGDGFVWTEDCDDTCDDCENKCEDCDDEGESAKCNRDCTEAGCGDGKVNQTAGEVCDEGEDDTANCDNDCTVPRCGDGHTNEAVGETCDDGGVETANCNANCTRVECGDQIVNEAAGEECDTGGPSSFCNANCRLSSCGDGETDTASGEICDTAGQSATCNFNCTTAMCGDGVVNQSFVVDPFSDSDTTATEQCDPDTGTDGGNSQRAQDSTPACDRDCTYARCGDGFRNSLAGEECDDQYVASGPKPHGATCDANCSEAACGDGTVNPAFKIDLLAGPDVVGEQCDPGNGVADDDPPRATADTATCNRDCSALRCGDGYRNQVAGEECDDQYVASGPKPHTASCNANCTNASCGDGVVNPQVTINRPGNDDGGETCDPGSPGVETAGCDADCSVPRCGDAYPNQAAGEECDDSFVPSGQPPNTKTCDRDCTAPACGDGIQNTTFEIDLLSPDGPSSNCPGFPCITEQCDPGTGTTDDVLRADEDSEFCDMDCSPARCGDDYINGEAGEECEHPYRTAGEDPPGDSSTCYANCKIPRCGDGREFDHIIDELCDPSTGATANAALAADDSSNCDADCTTASCGDGYTNSEAGEDCDDGNNTNDDDCPNNCTLP